MLEQHYKTINEAIKSISGYMVKSNSGRSKKLAEIKKGIDEAMTIPTTVLVCGEFKRGKSTFINALIGKQICPTDHEVCTSVVSILKYGEKEKVTKYYGDFSNINKEVLSIEDIEDFTVGNAAEIGNTLYLEIELPLDELKKGLRIIDTPGLGGLDPRHAMLTNYFLPQADVTLFMTEVGEPLSSTELEFYKKVAQYAKRNAVIINKSDTKAPEMVEEIRQDTISKLSEHAQIAPESIDVISVSALRCMKKKSDLGNFDKVRTLIYRMAEEFKGEILQEYRDELSEEIELAVTPLEAQLAQIECPDVDQIQVLKNKMSGVQEKLDALSNPNSGLRQKIASKISNEQYKINKSINELCTDFQTTHFNSLLKDSRATANGGSKWLGEQINNSIQELGSETAIRLNKTFNEIGKIKEFEGKLRFKVLDFEDEVIVKNPTASLPLNRIVSSAMSGWGPAIVSGVLLSSIGIGSILIPAIIGVGMAVTNVRDNSKAYTEAQLKQDYLPQIQSVVQNLRTYVANRFNGFQQESVRVLSKRIQEYKNTIDGSIKEIHRLKQETNIAVNQKLTLQNQIKPLKAAKDAIDKLEF